MQTLNWQLFWCQVYSTSLRVGWGEAGWGGEKVVFGFLLTSRVHNHPQSWLDLAARTRGAVSTNPIQYESKDPGIRRRCVFPLSSSFCASCWREWTAAWRIRTTRCTRSHPWGEFGERQILVDHPDFLYVGLLILLGLLVLKSTLRQYESKRRHKQRVPEKISPFLSTHCQKVMGNINGVQK